VNDFISEDDLKSFEGWLKYQGFDRSVLEPDELARWRDLFEELNQKSYSKVGQMKLGPVPTGQRRYAVAVREAADLWLTLWVRRLEKGDVYVMVPRVDREWTHIRATTTTAPFTRRALAENSQRRSGSR
jgi:hypothetical protein